MVASSILSSIAFMTISAVGSVISRVTVFLAREAERREVGFESQVVASRSRKPGRRYGSTNLSGSGQIDFRPTVPQSARYHAPVDANATSRRVRGGGCGGTGRRPPLSAPTASRTFLRSHWRLPLAPQGPPPARYSPLEASLNPEACGSCHPAQYADWRESTHAAATGPGIEGQLVEMLQSDPQSRSDVSCVTARSPSRRRSS
jgi:hypothetical protein